MPYINRFLSADTIVPDPTNPQAYNRYSYGYNNPIRYTDPTGHLSEDEIEEYFGYTEKQQMIDVYGQALADEIWGTPTTWGDVLQYGCSECENGVAYAMLLLKMGTNEIAHGVLWGIQGIHNGVNYMGREVGGHILKQSPIVAKSTFWTEHYKEHGYHTIPVNEDVYGLGSQNNTYMLAGAWYDAAFWRPTLFVAGFFVPGGPAVKGLAKFVQGADMVWGVTEEITDDVIGTGHPLGEYLTVYPTIRTVDNLHPHHENTISFTAPKGISN